MADADVNVPGVTATLDAPALTQLNVLLDPEAMLAGLAVNEVMVGALEAATVTVAMAVTEPPVLVAVRV